MKMAIRLVVLRYTRYVYATRECSKIWHGFLCVGCPIPIATNANDIGTAVNIQTESNLAATTTLKPKMNKFKFFFVALHRNLRTTYAHRVVPLSICANIRSQFIFAKRQINKSEAKTMWEMRGELKSDAQRYTTKKYLCYLSRFDRCWVPKTMTTTKTMSLLVSLLLACVLQAASLDLHDNENLLVY